MKSWAELPLTLGEVDQLLEQMITQQRAKVMRLAGEAVPDITFDDVLNPHDFPELKAHPTFEYEDGILAGYISSQMAIRAHSARKELQEDSS
jgi:hypothetical protein